MTGRRSTSANSFLRNLFIAAVSLHGDIPLPDSNMAHCISEQRYRQRGSSRNQAANASPIFSRSSSFHDSNRPSSTSRSITL